MTHPSGHHALNEHLHAAQDGPEPEERTIVDVHLPDPDALTIVLTERDAAGPEELASALERLPPGSRVIVLTDEERASLEWDAARSRDYFRTPHRPMHGPWTQELDRQVIDACVQAGHDAKVLLLDNGFGGLLILPESALVVTGPLPDDDPLATALRAALIPVDEQD